VYFFIYETKGLTLEQVDELYANVDTARKSSGYVPKINFQEEVRKASVSDAAYVRNYRMSVSEKVRRASVASQVSQVSHEKV
jgi:MFS transporter, SP family, sugar:H+ symporter